MKRPLLPSCWKNEGGSVLIIVILILIIMTVIGFAANNTSNIETQISGNDKFSKIAFHGADGGTEAAISLIEENISCPLGFGDPPNSLYNPTLCSSFTDDIIIGQVIVPDGNEDFKSNEVDTITPTHPSDPPNPANRDTYYYYPDDFAGNPPLDPASNQAHVNQTYNYTVGLGTGSSSKQLAGYDGAGKSAANSGGVMIFDLPAQRVESSDCVDCVRGRYEHRIGQEGTCSYY
jgi:hypothetical protein